MGFRRCNDVGAARRKIFRGRWRRAALFIGLVIPVIAISALRTDASALLADEESDREAAIQIGYFRKPGLRYDLEFDRRQFRRGVWGGGSTTVVSVDVLNFDVASRDLRFRWSLRRPVLHEDTFRILSATEESVVERILAAAGRHVLEFHFNEQGRPEILNRDVVAKQRAELGPLLDRAAALQIGSGGKTGNEFRKSLKEIWPFADLSFLNTANQIMHIPIGQSFVPGRVYKYRYMDRLPSTVRPSPIDGSRVLKFVPDHSPDDRVRLEYRHTVDPEVLFSRVMEVVEEINARPLTSAQISEIRSGGPMLYKHKYEYEIRPADGWIYQALHRGEIEINKIKQHITIRIRALTPAPPLVPDKTDPGLSN